jgi:hypothetical protein
VALFLACVTDTAPARTQYQIALKYAFHFAVVFRDVAESSVLSFAWINFARFFRSALSILIRYFRVRRRRPIFETGHMTSSKLVKATGRFRAVAGKLLFRTAQRRAEFGLPRSFNL